MDIKLKSNKYLIKAILIISILIGSVGLCTAYPRIEKDSERFSFNVFESKGYFLEEITQSNYVLYYETSKDMSEGVELPSDLYLDLESVNTNEDNISNYKDTFNNYLYEWDYKLSNDLSNLDYYVLNKNNNKVVKRSNYNLGELLDNNSYKSSKNKLKDLYEFYMVVDYDEHGNMNISNIHNADRDKVSDKIEEVQRDKINFQSYDLPGSKVKPIKNMTYVYAVSKKLRSFDDIAYAMQAEENYKYSQASTVYINIALGFVVLVSLLVPYKEVKDFKLYKIITRIPIEFLIIIIASSLAFIYGSSEIIMASSIRGELMIFNQLDLSNQVIGIITYSINIVYFAIWFSIISMGVFILKHIQKSKFIIYMKNNSLIIKFIRCTGRLIKNGITCLTQFDLKDKNNSKMVKLFIINLIILSIFCSFWFFGIIGVAVYTISIFIFIKNKYNKINEDYNKLLDITNKIANGNLEVNTQEDLGMFNSLRDEISDIQKGFKNAVREEVKSQNMKTELISNVSHDLKTPLTSIITYVELLKDENLSQEKREDYLGVLDRKSQRLKELIEDLFEVSKATSGDINLNLIDVDIVSLMKQTLLELDDKINESNLSIKKNLPRDKIILKLDSQRMFRVFENLIINITKYSMKGSRVYIDILEDEDEIMIILKNITAEEINYDVNYITDRFVRGDKSRNTDGSGLGLAIAKSFVELQGGCFEVITDGDLFKIVITFKKY